MAAYYPKGFNHGVFYVGYRGDTPPSKERLIECARESVTSDLLDFDISEFCIRHTFDSWHRYGESEYPLVVLRKDGRSYLHG